MLHKIHFPIIVVISFVLFAATGEIIADTSAGLEQAKSNIISLIQESKYAEAQVQTQKLITDFSTNPPDLPEALYWIADGYRWEVKHEQAKNLYQQIIQSYPDNLWAHKAELGVLRSDVMSLIMSQDFDRAQEILNRIIADFPQHEDFPETIYWIAERYRWEEGYEQAKNLYEQIMQHYPDSEYANRAKLGISRAEVFSLIASQDCNQAEEVLDKMVADFNDHPDLPETLYWFAERYRWERKYEQAKNLYEQVMQDYPGSVYASRARLGISRAEVFSLIESQDYNQAQEAIDKMVADFNDHADLPETLYWIAERYQWDVKHEQAKNLYKQIIQNYPDSAYASRAELGISRAKVLSLIVSQDCNRAEKALDRLVADFSEHPDLQSTIFMIGEGYYNRAFHCENEGRDTEAKEHLQKAITIWERVVTDFPESDFTVQAYYFTAGCYRRLGQYEKAIEYYQRVVSKWPNYQYTWNAQFMVGCCYEELKDAATVEKSVVDARIKAAYEQVIQKYPDCPAVYAARQRLEHTAKLKEKAQK